MSIPNRVRGAAAKLPEMGMRAFGAAGTVVMLAGWLVPGLVLWALGWACLLLRLRSNLRNRAWGDELGFAVPERVVLAAGVAAPLALGGSGALGWIGLGLLLLVLIALPIVQGMGRPVLANASGLPGFGTAPRLSRSHALAAQTTLVLPLLLMFFALLPLPWWAEAVMPLSALVTLPLLYRAARHTRRRNRQGREAPDAISQKLAEMQPRFVLYWTAHPNSQYQIAMWIPYLQRVGMPFFILVRDAGLMSEAAAVAGGAPVVYAPSWSVLDRMIPNSLTTAFYVTHADRNWAFLRFPQLTHVYLGHGDSEKTPSFNPVSSIYDKVYVAGQAAIDRYDAHDVMLPIEKFAIVGRPQVESIERDESSIGAKAAPTVLYAPTWAGAYSDSAYSSTGRAMPLIDDLLRRGCVVIFRPHPYSYQDPELAAACRRVIDRLRAHREETGTPHRFGQEAEQSMTVNECFNASDAMIADVSSVISDYLFSGKPLGLVTSTAATADELSAWPLARGLYVFDEEGSWEGVLDRMLGEDPLAERRADLRDYYLGAFPAQDYAEVFIGAVRAQVEGGKAAVVREFRQAWR